MLSSSVTEGHWNGLHPCGREINAWALFGEGEIRRYVALDRPLGCAGAFRAEGAGAALWASFRGDDPSAIVGLPLRGLVRCLRAAGLVVP